MSGLPLVFGILVAAAFAPFLARGLASALRSRVVENTDRIRQRARELEGTPDAREKAKDLREE